jgi:para-nitrobenzyl esterase
LRKLPIGRNQYNNGTRTLMLERFVPLAVIAICFVASAAAEPASTKVTLKAGQIVGVVSGDILSFKGIPYAQPPTDDLRWRPPQPLESWPDTPIKDHYGSDCLQMLADTKAFGSENCLFLNVWRPAEKTSSDERLPVLVWIHGGGLVVGGSSDKIDNGIYDGSELARQGLVVVSLNYRLGRLGFFAHPALISESGSAFSGNFGLMDQILALQWVQTNIGKFGGDNGQVTVVGESAGGISVLHLLITPKTKGLFQRVIIMSGAGRRTVLLRQMTGGMPDRPSAEMIGETFAKLSLGIEGSGSDALAKLRAVPKDDKRLVQDLTFDNLVRAMQNEDLQSGMVMIDGGIVKGEPGDVICHPDAGKLPVVIGTVANEIPLFLPPITNPYSYFGAKAGDASAYYDHYFPFVREEIGMDITMNEPARFVAKAMRVALQNVWLYRFTYVASGDWVGKAVGGTLHSGELPFLFQTLDRKYPGQVSPNDREMARKFSGYFTNFAKSASRNDPNPTGVPPLWQPFDSSFQLMHFREQGPNFEDEPRGGARGGVALVEEVRGSHPRPCGLP